MASRSSFKSSLTIYLILYLFLAQVSKFYPRANRYHNLQVLMATKDANEVKVNVYPARSTPRSCITSMANATYHPCTTHSLMFPPWANLLCPNRAYAKCSPLEGGEKKNDCSHGSEFLHQICSQGCFLTHQVNKKHSNASSFDPTKTSLWFCLPFVGQYSSLRFVFLSVAIFILIGVLALKQPCAYLHKFVPFSLCQDASIILNLVINHNIYSKLLVCAIQYCSLSFMHSSSV